MKEKDSTIRIKLRTMFDLRIFGGEENSYDDIITVLLDDIRFNKKHDNNNYYNMLRFNVKKHFILCDRCLNNRALQIHHKNSDKNNNCKENLNALCKSCHKMVHNPQLVGTQKDCLVRKQ